MSVFAYLILKRFTSSKLKQRKLKMAKIDISMFDYTIYLIKIYALLSLTYRIVLMTPLLSQLIIIN